MMDEVKYGKLTLRLEEGKYIVAGCEKDATEVIIPSEVDGVAVWSIGDHAFEGCKDLRSVILPNQPEPVEIEDIIKSFDDEPPRIGDHAFMGCISLEEIYVPKCFCSIGWSAFYGCKNLKRAILPGDPYLCTCAFAECVSLVEVTPCQGMGDGAFGGCVSLTSLPLSQNASSISEDAFEHCDGLVNIVIPKSVKHIGSLAFRGCKNLASVVFESPKGWTEHSSYTGKDYPLDLSDPQRNARMLSRMDFDDGVYCWEIK